uniref:RING-type E3 ubiquitin transferase n=1 Tax=Daucus carota subsp. sativus TaxID=79200 RepID=A0A175YHZ9_DAUCS
MASAAATERFYFYFCHQCNHNVAISRMPNTDPLCPSCRYGFLEEIDVPRLNPNRDPVDPLAPSNARTITGVHYGPRGPTWVIMEAPSLTGVIMWGIRGLVGPTFSLCFRIILLAELAENDPDRYGTPPASRTAVEGLPDVVVDDKLLGSDSAQCAVCQDDFEKDMVVKQMPSKHVYHSECLLPWLELHNSCPVCRYELPSDDPDYENRARGIAASGGENDASGNVRFGSPGSQTDTGDDEEGGQFRSFVERTFSIMFRPRNSGTDNSGGDSGSSCPQNMGTN